MRGIRILGIIGLIMALTVGHQTVANDDDAFIELYGRKPNIETFGRFLQAHEESKHIRDHQAASYDWARKQLKSKKPDTKTPEALYIISAALEEVCPEHEKYPKALYCRGIAKSRLATQITNPNQTAQKALMRQEAFYLLSMSGDSDAPQTMQQMVDNGWIAHIIGNPDTRKEANIQSFQQTTEEILCEMLRTQSDELHAILSMVSEAGPSEPATADSPAALMQQTLRAGVQDALADPTKIADVARALCAQGNFGTQIEALAASSVQASAQEGDETAQREVANLEALSFTPKHTHLLAGLWLDIHKLLHTTAKCPTGQTPAILAIGRSPAWIVKLNECLPEKDRLPLIHALGTGLRQEDISPEQINSYEAYLTSLGLREIEASSKPLILLDTAETGGSLLKMTAIIEERFRGLKGRIQHLVLMAPGETVNLPKARITPLLPALRNLFYAKHALAAQMCPFPQLYPGHFPEWRAVIAGFKVPDGAKRLEEELKGNMRKGSPAMTLIQQRIAPPTSPKAQG